MLDPLSTQLQPQEPIHLLILHDVIILLLIGTSTGLHHKTNRGINQLTQLARGTIIIIIITILQR